MSGQSDDEGGFFSRWARRKTQARSGERPLPEEAAPQPAALVPAAPAPAPVQVELQPAPAPPTIEDVEALTPESDYSRFVARGTDETVKRAAMKKLFSDPRFNVMDGLDTYIDDYSKPDPIPLSMLRQLNQSKLLGLFDHEDEQGKRDGAQPAMPGASPDAAGAQDVSPSTQPPAQPAAPTQESDEDADLQLQPDDAHRREVDRGGAGSEG